MTEVMKEVAYEARREYAKALRLERKAWCDMYEKKILSLGFKKYKSNRYKNIYSNDFSFITIDAQYKLLVFFNVFEHIFSHSNQLGGFVMLEGVRRGALHLKGKIE